MRAKSVINSLPRQLYSELMPQQSAAAATTKPVTVFSGAVLSSPVAEPTERDERSSSNKKQCVRAADGCCDAAAGTTSAAQAVQTERCVVCMDDFEAQEELVVFPCKHYFHIPCTEGWLAVSSFAYHFVVERNFRSFNSELRCCPIRLILSQIIVVGPQLLPQLQDQGVRHP